MRAAERVLLYANTVRYLKFGQIASRFLNKLPKPRPSARAAALRAASGVWRPPIEKPQAVLGANRFRFLNREETLSFPAGWNDPRLDKLWLYNLHYFDDLSAVADGDHAKACKALMERWVEDNPAPAGNGWEPYPLSLRIVNWLKRALAGDALSPVVMASLAQQARALEQRIEWHLLANHLFANAKALVFAGLCFGGREGDRWLSKGQSILARQLSEQVLADGGHIERSPMYHAILLEDVLDLINVANARFGLDAACIAALKSAANRMRTWLAAMSHPDGDISFFNDCAFGVAAKPAELEDYAARLGLPATQELADVEDLFASGYVAVRKRDFTLMFDAAPVGPDYQPGHAHADTLSLEVSFGADRLLVNSGVSSYQTGPERSAERATAAHNTVEIDGANSSEIWAAFRVARRARILTREVGKARIDASHDGYRRLPGRPVHRRSIGWGINFIMICDEIDGAHSRAIARYRLAPGLIATATSSNGRRGVVTLDGRPVARWSSTQPGLIKQTSHATAFNIRKPSLELEFNLDGRALEVVWTRAH